MVNIKQFGNIPVQNYFPILPIIWVNETLGFGSSSPLPTNLIKGVLSQIIKFYTILNICQVCTIASDKPFSLDLCKGLFSVFH